MVWIFAAVVLTLAVYSEGFRKFALWCGGAAVVVFIIAAIVIN
jgi:hypothetical protein